MPRTVGPLNWGPSAGGRPCRCQHTARAAVQQKGIRFLREDFAVETAETSKAPLLVGQAPRPQGPKLGTVSLPSICAEVRAARRQAGGRAHRPWQMTRRGA